jgi:serine/threonine protein kinase
MTADQRRSVEEWFDRLADTPLDDARDVLQRDCDDPQVRQEVVRLVASARLTAAATGDLQRHVSAIAPQLGGLGPGTKIGPYVILEQIGAGGMGEVYKAEQRHPIKRTVAIKIIKLGFDTRDIIARFESERQALARMDHPNVARVIDAGSTDTGRPYFVMEYVPGVPITKFADDQQLDLKQRLRLFIQACHAIAHAHTKALIHRDIKASNVLAFMHDGTPMIKVIDFGIAKALAGDRLSEITLNTGHGQMIGTFESMSPEQADGSPDIDTRTDVYSLGVLLYELLTGVKPFDRSTLTRATDEEVRRIIREVDPPRPSTKLSSLGDEAERVTRCRHTSLDMLTRQLKGELEWIPLKAMRKERAQRYATASELADDILNYLENRPLIAGPESRAYRSSKFLRRHWRGVAASAAMVFLLIGGIVATSWQAVRATRAQNEARAAQARAEAVARELRDVNRFLTDDLLASAAPAVGRGKELTVSEAVDRAADSVATRFRDHPLTEATIRSTLADTYDALGFTERALPHAQAALEIYRPRRGPDDEATIVATAHVGELLAKLNRHAEAEPMLRDVLARSEKLLGAEHHVTLDCIGALARSLRMQERFAEAETLYRRMLDGDRRVHGPQSREAAMSLNSLAVLLNTQGRSAEAEPLYREALAIRKELLGTDHPSYLSTQGNLARVLEAQDKLPEAEALLRQVLTEKRRVLKDDHPETTSSIHALASVLAQQQKYEESETLSREVVEIRLRTLGEDDIDTLQSMSNLARTLTLRGKYVEAEAFYRRAIDGRSKVLGEKHPHTLNSMSGLAGACEAQEKFADAEAMFARLSQPGALEVFPPARQAVIVAHHGRCLVRLGEASRAEPVLLEARRRLLEIGQAQSEEMWHVLEALADVCEKTNRAAQAADFRAEQQRFRATTTVPATGAASRSRSAVDESGHAR